MNDGFDYSQMRRRAFELSTARRSIAKSPLASTRAPASPESPRQFSQGSRVILVGLAQGAPEFDGRRGIVRGAIGPNGRLPVLLPPRGAEDFAATALSASSGAVRGSRTVYVKPENLIADVLDGASRDGASKKRTSPIAQRVAKAAERAEASFLDNLSAGDSKRGGVTAAAPAASKTQRKEKKGAARASSSADAKAAADPAAMLEDEQAAGENGSEAGAGERFQWWFEYLNRLRDVAESVRPPDPTPQQLAAGRKAVRVLRERPAALRSLNTAPRPEPQPEASTDRTAGVAGGSRAPEGTAFARERDIAPDAGAGGVRAAEAGVREALARGAQRNGAGWLQDQLRADVERMVGAEARAAATRGLTREALRRQQEQRAAEDEQARVLHRLRQAKIEVMIQNEREELKLQRQRRLIEHERRRAAREALEKDAADDRERRERERQRRIAQAEQARLREAKSREASADNERPGGVSAKPSADSVPGGEEGMLEALLVFAGRSGAGQGAPPDLGLRPSAEDAVPRLNILRTTRIEGSERDDDKKDSGPAGALAKATEQLTRALGGADAARIDAAVALALELGAKPSDPLIAAARARADSLRAQARADAQAEAQEKALRALQEREAAIRAREDKIREAARQEPAPQPQPQPQPQRPAGVSREEVAKAVREAEANARIAAETKMKEELARAKDVVEKARAEAAEDRKRHEAEMEQRQRRVEAELKNIREQNRQQLKVAELEAKITQLTSEAKKQPKDGSAEAQLFAERSERMRSDMARQLRETREALAEFQRDAKDRAQRDDAKDSAALKALEAKQLEREARLLRDMEERMGKAIATAVAELNRAPAARAVTVVPVAKQEPPRRRRRLRDSSDSSLTSSFDSEDMPDDLLSEGEVRDSGHYYAFSEGAEFEPGQLSDGELPPAVAEEPSGAA